MLLITCDFLKKQYQSCLEINITVFGKERGPSMCKHFKDWYEFCLTQK